MDQNEDNIMQRYQPLSDDALAAFLKDKVDVIRRINETVDRNDRDKDFEHRNHGFAAALRADRERKFAEESKKLATISSVEANSKIDQLTEQVSRLTEVIAQLITEKKDGGQGTIED